MEHLWIAADKMHQAAGAAQQVADKIPAKVAYAFVATEQCAWRHRDLSAGAALGNDMQAWSDHLTDLSDTIAATAQLLHQAAAGYTNADASAAADLDRARGDLGMELH